MGGGGDRVDCRRVGEPRVTRSLGHQPEDSLFRRFSLLELSLSLSSLFVSVVVVVVRLVGSASVRRRVGVSGPRSRARHSFVSHGISSAPRPRRSVPSRDVSFPGEVREDGVGVRRYARGDASARDGGRRGARRTEGHGCARGDAAFVREEDESFRLDEEERFLGVEVGLGPDGVAKLGEMASSRADNLRDGVARAPDGDGERVGTRAKGVDHAATRLRRRDAWRGCRASASAVASESRTGDSATSPTPSTRIALGPPRRNKSAVSAAGGGRFRGGSIAGRTSAALLRTVAVAEATRVSGRQGPRWRAARHRPEIVRREKSRHASRHPTRCDLSANPPRHYPRRGRRSPAARPAMQRFGFLRRTGSGVGGDDDASVAVDAKHGSPHKSRGSTSSTAGVGSDHADDGSSDSGSDDSRATTVVKHSHNHSISSQHSVGDYPEWLHRDERDPRGSSSSTAGTHTVFPGPPAGPLHRVDSRTHINEALHTVPGLRNRGIDLPMTRRLAFRKCRGVARSRSLALIIFAFVAVGVPRATETTRGRRRRRGHARRRRRSMATGDGRRSSRGRAMVARGRGRGLRGTGTGTGTGRGRRWGGRRVSSRRSRALAAVGRGTSADRRRIRRGGEGGGSRRGGKRGWGAHRVRLSRVAIRASRRSLARWYVLYLVHAQTVGR